MADNDAGILDAAGSEGKSSAQQFADIMAQNELLAKENRLLDSYLHRRAQGVNWDELKVPSKRKEWAMTQYQKYNIGIQEHDYRTKQLKELEEKAAEDISLLKAITEGIKIRINEMRKETYEFKRDIVIGGENTRTGKIMAEKVTHYWDEKLKQKGSLTDKIKLKNAAMKNNRGKMDAQIRTKEEQGDSLHSIDFHQLQIKNSQFNQKINERNTELLKLKMSTGKTVQVLNKKKREMNALLAESKALKQDIQDRREANVRLSNELLRVEAEVKLDREKNKKFKIQQSNPDMPQVLDYVNQKSVDHELDAQIRNWQRKNEIIEIAAKRARRFLKNFEGAAEQEQNMERFDTHKPGNH